MFLDNRCSEADFNLKCPSLKMFVNIIVSIGCAVVIFQSYKPTGSTNSRC